VHGSIYGEKTLAGTLDGIRVVDLTTVILGPWATQMLGDMGADVIKIETPVGDTTRQGGPKRNPGMGSFFMTANRNKRSIVLDLTTEAGRDALFKLVGTADVFVHNMRPKVAKKLGLEYERFAKAYPDLVFCATYGFRADGPRANAPAYDDIIQAASGIADLMTIIADEPRFVPTIVADKTSALNVAAAILAALVAKERGQGGQAIEVPMFECLVDYNMVEHLNGAAFDPPIGPMGYARLMNKGRRPYATTDGYLAVLPYTDQNWKDFLRMADREDLNDDPRFASLASRTEHSDYIYTTLGEIVATRSSAEWQRDLDSANIPVMVVNRKEDLLEDEQLKASGFWRFEEHPSEGRIRLTDPPIRFSKNPSTIRRLQPRLGEHSREILSEAGYSDAEVQALLDAGASIQLD
jgi:crotonobetainyl-CoA:carnitine CoA-transferase CaiB-like acyl-CoA transferase